MAKSKGISLRTTDLYSKDSITPIQLENASLYSKMPPYTQVCIQSIRPRSFRSHSLLHSRISSASDNKNTLPRAPQGNTVRGPDPYGANGEAALHECAALSMECRGEHLCNHKRANWSLHPLRAYCSPQGYKCRTPGAWGGRKPSAFSYYK